MSLKLIEVFEPKSLENLWFLCTASVIFIATVHI
jgi:hypothetical protein